MMHSATAFVDAVSQPDSTAFADVLCARGHVRNAEFYAHLHFDLYPVHFDLHQVQSDVYRPAHSVDRPMALHDCNSLK